MGSEAAPIVKPGPVAIHLALPKGHMQENVFKLFEDAGIKVSLGHTRGYRPMVPLENYDVKLLKPQNILGMLHAGTRDVGFAGRDWVEELGITDVVEILNTDMDPVRIVAAAPDVDVMRKGGKDGRKVIVASEYEGLTRKWLAAKGYDCTFLRAYGATESLPPEDADVIVDNAATGSTLRANNLEVFDTLMNSTTCLYASKAAWENPEKKARIQQLVTLLQSVLNARKRLMVTFNTSRENLETILQGLPALKAPTVSELHHKMGFAVQIAAPAETVPVLIPRLHELGGSDIVVSSIKMLVA